MNWISESDFTSTYCITTCYETGCSSYTSQPKPQKPPCGSVFCVIRLSD